MPQRAAAQQGNGGSGSSSSKQHAMLSIAKEAEASARSAIQQGIAAEGKNQGPVDCRTGAVKAAGRSAFWRKLLRDGGWLHVADANAWDPKSPVEEVIKATMPYYVCHPLVRSTCDEVEVVGCSQQVACTHRFPLTATCCLPYAACHMLPACAQVLYEHLKKDGELACPGCGKCGCLRGGGLRAESVLVLEQPGHLVPGQFRVFTWNLEHVGCTQERTGKTGGRLAMLQQRA